MEQKNLQARIDADLGTAPSGGATVVSLKPELSSAARVRRELGDSLAEISELRRELTRALDTLRGSQQFNSHETKALRDELRRVESRLKEAEKGLTQGVNELRTMLEDTQRSVLYLAEVSQQRQHSLAAQLERLTVRIERYTNVWPLRMLRRLRKKLLRV